MEFRFKDKESPCPYVAGLSKHLHVSVYSSDVAMVTMHC